MNRKTEIDFMPSLVNILTPEDLGSLLLNPTVAESVLNFNYLVFRLVSSSKELEEKEVLQRIEKIKIDGEYKDTENEKFFNGIINFYKNQSETILNNLVEEENCQREMNLEFLQKEIGELFREIKENHLNGFEINGVDPLFFTLENMRETFFKGNMKEKGNVVYFLTELMRLKNSLAGFEKKEPVVFLEESISELEGLFKEIRFINNSL